MTSGRGGLQLWKCLYLARNVTKGNNVLSQSTLMDLPTISPASPLTGEPSETTANKAALPFKARVLLTPVKPHPAPQTPTLTSDPCINSYRLSTPPTCWSSFVIVRLYAKEFHLKCTFYSDNTAAHLNVSSGRACTSVL